MDLVSLLKDSTSIKLSTENINRSSATCSLSLITTTTLSTVPYTHRKMINNPHSDIIDTHELKFLSYSFHSSRDIRIESRMPRLKDGRIIFLTTDEQIRGIYLSDIQDSMHRDFDYLDPSRQIGFPHINKKYNPLNSVIPRIVSAIPVVGLMSCISFVDTHD
jgi:hypothetical protein